MFWGHSFFLLKKGHFQRKKCTNLFGMSIFLVQDSSSSSTSASAAAVAAAVDAGYFISSFALEVVSPIMPYVLITSGFHLHFVVFLGCFIVKIQA